MKRKLFKILPIVFLGGILGISALSEVQQISELKAEAQEVVLEMTGAKCKDAMGTSGYSSTDFTYGGISFGRKNVYVIQNGSSYKIQTKGNTSNGFWTKTTIADTYISKIEITVGNAAVNLFLSSDTSFSTSTSVAVGSASYTYSKTDNYHYFKVLSNGTYNTVSLKITYTPSAGGSVDPTPAVGDFALVKDASTLKTGDEIVLGVKDKKVAAGSFSSKSLTGVPATFVEETLSSANANVLTLSKTDNGFKMLSSEGYVGTSVVKEISLNTETEWSISIDSSSYKATIAAGDYGHIMYNCNSTSIFRNYNSGESDSLLLPEIYINTKAVVSNFKVTYDGNGHTGTVLDSNSYAKASEVTVLTNAFDEKTGEVFKEWNTKADGSGTSYQPNDKFTITSDVILYAIWEEEYIPVGDTFTKITTESALSNGDKFLFVYNSGDTTKVNGSLEGGDHFTAYDAKIVNDELSYNNEKVTPLTLVKEGSDYYIELNGSYLTLTSNSSNKLAWKTKANANKWTISFNNGNAVVSSSIENISHSIYYNGGGTGRFSNYSSSTMSPIEMWAKSGHAKEVTLDKTAIDLNVDQTVTLKVQECLGFTPTSYAWEVTTGSEFVGIIAGQGTQEITLKGLAEGEAEVYVTVDGVKAKAEVVVHDYKYNILNKDAYYITADGAMMCGDLSYTTKVDFSESNMWSFEKAYKGDNSYYLRSSGKYLTFSEDYVADGKNISEIELTALPYNAWTVTYTDGKGYMVSTQTNKQGVRSLATHEGKWYAFTDNHYVGLLEAGSYDHYEVKSLPTTKQYFVGEDLKPLNAHVYAVYTNGFETEITSDILWDTLVAGTKATGKVTIGGEERTIEMEGIQVYKGDATTFVIEGLEDNYALGEKINKDFLSVSITYKLSGYEDIEKTLTKNDYVVTPERIEEGTTSVRIALAKDPTVYFEKAIEIKESPYVAANYIGVGDEVVIGTLGYNPYEITGGVELSYDGTKFGYSNFGYMPKGDMVFEVGKQGSYYTLQDKDTGFYLKGDNSAFGFNKPDTKSVYAEGDGHYEFNMPVTINGSSYIVTMKTDQNPDFSYTNVLYSFDYINGGYNDYISGRSDLENNKFIFDIYIGGVYSETVAEVSLAYWSFENNVFQYALETSSTLPEECLFTLTYDEDYEEWVVSSKPHQDKQLYFNKDGKFGFYAIGSSYTPIMLFRNNDKPLQSEVQSLSVSFQEGMNEVTVGEQFPWTSALIVKAHYAGGASKIIPVGGYSITKMPNTTVIGTATGEVSYGQNGHEITKEFTINVKGHTQAFDVVCKDPILVGETYQAHLADHYEVPEGEPLVWSVSDPTLASIDQNGNVTGLAPGYVNVIATSFDGTYSDFEYIRIYQQVESVTLDKEAAEINAGETVQLNATVLPANASNTKVTYSSSDPNIAFVDANTGLVTGVKEGTVTITCAAQNNPDENFDTCTVTVKEAPIVHVTGITLDCTYKEIEVKGTFKLNALITPEDATVKNVTWSSNHENIATVDQNGNVKGVAKGECVITATTADGGLTASCTIKVKTSAENIPATSVTLNQRTASLEVGDKLTLVATVLPSNADNKNVSWSSSDESIATVSNGVVTAVGQGQVTITATTSNGLTATCLITIGNISVNKVNISETKATLEKGKTLQLSATVEPINATNKNVIWSSSNESVAVVSSTGKVTAKDVGTAIITVKTVDGEFTASCVITVTKAATGGEGENQGGNTEGGGSSSGNSSTQNESKGLFGCFGSVTASCAIISIVSLAGVGLLLTKKRK